MTTKQSYTKTVFRICIQRRPPRRHLNLSGTLLTPCASLLTVSRTLNFLFKMLFIFLSQYLFAIGLVPIFSFRRSLPPFYVLFCKLFVLFCKLFVLFCKMFVLFCKMFVLFCKIFLFLKEIFESCLQSWATVYSYRGKTLRHRDLRAIIEGKKHRR